ncbi:MAG: NUDIX domain-containing protein [Clostridia bacterium]|nr:NUDIX domain-containing protein [Clostridia bacterium]
MLIHSAGAALYTVADGEVLWVLVKEKSGRIGLPKGQIEPGETPAQAALREIREETGVHARLYRDVPPLEDVYRMADGRTKKVTYYLARFDGCEVHYDPTQVDGAMLLPTDRALTALTHASARKVLRRAAEIVRKIV